MHLQSGRKTKTARVFRGLVALLLVVIMTTATVFTGWAATVTAIVIDGDTTYTFSMISADEADVLREAEALGLPPVGELDKVEWVGNTTTVNILRGVPIQVTLAGTEGTIDLTGYKGTNVRRALEDNNIILREADEVTPDPDTLISAGMQVEIRRANRVTVIADGESVQVSLVGGTVRDALDRAQIILGKGDSANYKLEEHLFDKMTIRVHRVETFTVTADGETKEYSVSAGTVAQALAKCGVKLGDDDRLNVRREARLTGGMEIIVYRVTFEEITEEEIVDYEFEYVADDDMYDGETEILTEGEEGLREVTYKITYVDGEEEGREEVDEKIITEPVTKVIAYGTKGRSQAEWSENLSAGTFVDCDGNVVSYSSRLVGTCTAYYPFSPTTSLGWTCQRGIIAVDPNIIPYGTRMYVVSPDGSIVYGYGVAGDTGGACMNGDIIADLCYDTIEECSIIGRRDMVIYILN